MVAGTAVSAGTCRLCAAPLQTVLVDLGEMPPANALLDGPDDVAAERALPLCARVCDVCRLVQVPENVGQAEIFSEYSYFSSYSTTFLEHAREYAHRAAQELSLGPDSLVVEVASNDGYLLRHFHALGIGVLGIEPAANVARAAEALGLPTRVAFLDSALGREIGPRADLVVANNVLGHVPDLRDFVAGLAAMVRPDGVVSVEVHHVLRLLEGLQVDTVYHEHRSYFSLLTASRALESAGLAVFDAELIPTHGGSLRLWAAPAAADRTPTPEVGRIAALERAAGLDGRAVYAAFAARAQGCRDALERFLAGALAAGETVAAYGAAAKGATLLNWVGATTETVRCVADRNPYKQGRLMPGTHIPIVPPQALDDLRPDHLLILPWNLTDEIVAEMARVRGWGGRFVIPVPELQVRP